MLRIVIITLTFIAIHFAISNLSQDSDLIVGICALVIPIALYVLYWVFKPTIQKLIKHFNN